MRRPIAALLALALLIAGPSSALAAGPPPAGFLAGTEDVPLMSGLHNVADSLVLFDKPEGRILEAEARGRVTRAAVEKFYAATLPQLGWVADGPQVWHREGEELRLEFKGHGRELRVGFTLSPR